VGNLPARARRGHADGNFELQGDFCGMWGIYGAKGPFSLVGIGLCEGGACAVWSLPNRVTGPRPGRGARRGHTDCNFELQGDFCGVWGIWS